jgi:hypothetical protein
MHDLQALRRATQYQAHAPSAGATDRAKGNDRRKAPRVNYAVEGTGALRQRDGGVPHDFEKDFPIVTLNLSQYGLAFLANYCFEVNDVLDLFLPTKDNGPKKVRVKVVRTKRAGIMAFETGAEFAV